MTVPSPAELWWRIRWLSGTAVPPEPGPAPVPAWLQVPTLGEIEPPRRSRLRDSIQVELHREAQRVYVAAQHEVNRRIVAAYGVPDAQLGQLRASSFRYVAGPPRCAECARQRRHTG